MTTSAATLTTPAISLRPYQIEALRVSEEARESGANAALWQMATGAGKTLTFAELARRWNVPTLIIAHREELLLQSRATLRAIWSDVDVGILGAGLEEMGHRVTIASIQSAVKPKRLEQLAAGGIRLVIIDEAHHASARTYRRLIEALHAGEEGGDCFLLGVTATPDRGDGASIEAIFGEPIVALTLPAMIRARWLCDLRGVEIRTTTRIDGVRTRAGDFREDELAAVVNQPERNKLIVEAWKRHAAGRPTLVFCVDVAHAYALAEAFRAAGVTAIALDGSTPRQDRHSALHDYATGRISVVCNCQLFTEGMDAPQTACVILARPTQSRILYAQAIGRGTRLAPGKSDCLVLDVADVTGRHRLAVQSLPRLVGRKGYGAPRFDELSDPDDASATSEAGWSVRHALEETLAPVARGVVERDVDLLDEFRWAPFGDGNYRLLLEAQRCMLTLLLRDDGYVASVTWRDGTTQDLTPRPVALDWAQSTAERAALQVVRDLPHLVDRRAAWRQYPASEKQYWMLRKLGVRVRGPLSKGEASQMIDAALAGQSA